MRLLQWSKEKRFSRLEEGGLQKDASKMNMINCVTDLMAVWKRASHAEREDTRIDFQA